jgi:hypothetical protein
MKTRLEKNLLKVCQMLYEYNEYKTPLEKRQEYDKQLEILTERYKIKLIQLKQDYLLQRRILFAKLNNE